MRTRRGRSYSSYTKYGEMIRDTIQGEELGCLVSSYTGASIKITMSSELTFERPPEYIAQRVLPRLFV